MSLPQRAYTTGYVPDVLGPDGTVEQNKDDRTLYLRKRFDKGWKKVNVYYGHPYVTTLVCDFAMPASAENPAPIDERGWCVFEKYTSSIVKDNRCCLYLSLMPSDAADMDWRDLMDKCSKGARLPPLAADKFEAMMREGMAGGKLKFTNGKDATEVCIPQYKEALLRLMGEAKQLGYVELGWGEAEGEQLAEALLYVQRCGVACGAELLDLYDNQLGSAGVRAIGAALQAGAMPMLKYILIHDNDADKDTEKWMKELCKAKGVCPGLSYAGWST